MIYKMFDGRPIDLSKVLEITDAVFDDRMGSGGWFVSFSILYQLQDNRSWYTYDVEQYIKLPDDWTKHTYDHNWVYENVANPACAELQKKIDEVISVWKSLVEKGE